MVIDISYFRPVRGGGDDFKEFLRSGPDFDDLDLTRSRDFPRETDWD